MTKISKKRLFEVMSRLDKTFKPNLNEDVSPITSDIIDKTRKSIVGNTNISEVIKILESLFNGKFTYKKYDIGNDKSQYVRFITMDISHLTGKEGSNIVIGLQKGNVQIEIPQEGIFNISNVDIKKLKEGWVTVKNDAGEPIGTEYQPDSFDPQDQPEFDDREREPYEGLRSVNAVDWKTVHEILVSNTNLINAGKAHECVNANDLIDDEILTRGEIGHLEDWNIIYNDKIPELYEDKYRDFNTFKSKVLEIWEKEPPSWMSGKGDSEAPYLRGYEPMSEQEDVPQHAEDVPIDPSNPDRMEKDLTYNTFRNGAYYYGAIDTSNPDPKYEEMFRAMETGKVPVKKEYVYLKNRGSGAIILALKLYTNGWAVVFSISQREKFPVVIDTPITYGIYSEFVFPPNKVRGAFDFVRIEKDDLMKKGFHLYESNELKEQRYNPIVGTDLTNDKNFMMVLKNIKDWFTGRKGYIEPHNRELFKNLAVKEITDLLNKLNA